MALLKDHLIAHYKLNDDAATAVVVDATGTHNGTYKDVGGNLNTDTGASTGKIFGALDFDGTDEYVEIADHDDFTPAGTPFSISVGVYMHDATDFWIIVKRESGVVKREWQFLVGSDDKLYWALFDDGTGSYIGRLYNTALTTYENTWLHLVATYDGGVLSSGCKVYLNGTRVDDADNKGGTFVAVENLTAPVHIGRYSTAYADGLIDNVMFFNKELTPLEVKLLYNGGAGVETIPSGIQLSRTGQRFSSHQEI